MYFISYFSFQQHNSNLHTLIDRYLGESESWIYKLYSKLNLTIWKAHYEHENIFPCFHISNFTPTSAYYLNSHTHVLLCTLTRLSLSKGCGSLRDTDCVFKVNLSWDLVRQFLFDTVTRELRTFISLTHTKLALHFNSV